VVKALEAAGALRLNVVAGAPTELTGGPRPDDETFDLVTARRPVAESVVAACAEATPAVVVRRGVGVSGLTTGSSHRGVPHVTGVRTDRGEEIGADLVVDTTGRRSPLPAWLADVGAMRPREELEDSGFIYYGLHFRSADGSLPAVIAPFLQNYGSVSVLTLPADNGTWGVAIIASAADTAMRAVRDVAVWMDVVRALPLAAHWVDGEPLEDRVQILARIEDRHRSFVIDGEPVATGVVAVGDSWACTNPSLGRGISLGLMHAVALRQVVRDVSTDDPAALAAAWDEATAATVEPWYRATLSTDRHRLAEVHAHIAGEPYRPADPAWDTAGALQMSAGLDPDCFRALLSIVGVLRTPQEALAEPGLLDKVMALGADWRDVPDLGPNRKELLSVVSP
jgi:2-polyprenyl-6-methoxyphenol hydroxylase-like FAD-dependent oxidoreductase